MKVLVTGGAGLVGLALRRVLAAAGHTVIATDITRHDRDDPGLRIVPLGAREGLEQLVTETGVDAIVHSGGVSGPVMLREEPTQIADINIGSTATLLDLVRRGNLKRFVLLSSHVVYGDVGPGRIVEDRPLAPSSTYAATKIAGEALVESFRREFGVSAASLRVTRIYGPYRRANCFLRRAILDAAAGVATTIPCDPTFIYHYVYVDDVAAAVRAALEVPVLRHATYNVSSGERLTMPQVAAIAKRVLPSARLELVPGVDDAPEIQDDFDLERIAEDLGWRPAYPLERGLVEYAKAGVWPER